MFHRSPTAVRNPVSATARNRCRRAIALVAGISAMTGAVDALAVINANKTFTPDAVAVSQPSKVTFFFLNANTSAATALAFIDPLPAGMVIAPTPNFQVGGGSGCGGSFSGNPGDAQVGYTGGTVPAASGTTPGACQISFDVISATPGVYINSVPAGEVTSSQGPNSQNADATLNVSALSPITGTKTFNPGNLHGYLPVGGAPPAGGVSTVTITLSNPNSTALTNVAFTDIMPTTTSSPAQANGGIIVAPTPNASTTCGGTVTVAGDNRSVSLAGGSISAFGSCTVTFNVVAETPLVSAQGNVTNSIPANAVTTFEGVTNATFSGSVNRLTGALLAKSFSPSTIANGGTTVMTINVRNYNLTALSGIGFTDTLPADLTVGSPAQPALIASDCQSPSSTVASGFTFSAAPIPGATSFAISGGTLAAAPTGNASTNCNIRVNIVGSNSTLNAFNRTNGASNITGWTNTDNVQTGVSGGQVTVNPNSPITGTKSFSPSPIFQGASSVATIVLTNASGSDLTSVGFTDNVGNMGAGITVAAAPAPTSTCGMSSSINGTSTQITFSGGSILNGGTCTVTFTVLTANNAATGNRNNDLPVGTVTGVPAGGGPSVSNRLLIRGVLDVRAVATGSKAFSPGTVSAGADSLLTITVTRPGNLTNGQAAPLWTSFTITDPLPGSGATQHTVSPNNPPAGPPPGNACPGSFSPALSSGATSFTFASDPLPANFTSCVIRVNVRTPTSLASPNPAQNAIPAGNLVVVTGAGNYSNGSSITANLTRVGATVTLTKSFDPATIPLNGLSTMFVRIVNTGPNAVNLTGVGLIDNLPAGLRLSSTPGAVFTGGAGCSLGTLSAPALGTTVTLSNATVNAGKICSIQVQTQATVAGNLINQIPSQALGSTQGITNVEPVAATVTSTGLADLQITKTDGVTTVNANGTTTYTVVVTNPVGAGISDVAGATFTDNEPAGVTFTSWSCTATPGSACTPNGSGSISDTVNVAAGGSLTYTINASISAGACGTIQNTATITSPGSVVDSNPANNTATDTDTCAGGTIQLRKTWVNANVNDTAALTATGIVNGAAAALNSTANTADETDPGAAATMYSGETATLAETLSVPANYTSAVACVNSADGQPVPVTNNQVAMPPTPIAIVCTWTNTRKQGTIQLRKTWVNANVNDTAALTATGIVNSATAALNSTANTASETDPGSAVAMFAGETATLAETVNPAANYSSVLGCVDGATGGGVAVSNNQVTMPSTPVAIVCTWTNTRADRSLTLVKQWVNGANGDQISVTTQSSGNNATVGSTSTGSNQDVGSPVSVVPGTVVTLPAETFTPVGAASNYTVSVSCTGVTLPPPGVPGASFAMPDANVTCTYTNTRRSATLQLRKTWTNAVVNDTASLSATGLTNSATLALLSTANTANETDPGASATVYAGEVATISETVNSPSNATYSSNLVCTGNFNTLVGNQLTVSGDDDGATIVCTWTNGRTTPPFPGGGANPVPVNGPAGLALLMAVLALAGAVRTRRVRRG